jgi:rod shape-determining protein MreC
MESFFSRYRNLIVLAVALLLQVIGLAVQVRKPGAAVSAAGMPRPKADGAGVLLIRLWAASLVTPFERTIHGAGQGVTGLWTNYLDLRHTQQENKDLQATIDRLRLEQAELHEDALQGQRLQALVKFQQSYVYQTLAAQVIGTSGSRQSRMVYLDKGTDVGLKPDMAVITSEGIVGKVRDVFPHSAQVLLINDQTSGAGVVLATTRIRGILRGNAAGQPQVVNILADSRIQPGEPVLTAGGDQIFPRGLPVGVVEKVERDTERGAFINVIVKPAAHLDTLDEVLVVTSLEEHLSKEQMADLAKSEDLKGPEVAAAAAEEARKKAALEMEQRLPGLTDPNAPAPATVMGPDGKPMPAPPVAPKPLPVAHPDRFSPGAAGGTVGSAPAADGAAPAEEVPEAKEKPKAEPKPAFKPKTQASPGSNPAKTKPKAPQFSGRVQ